MFYKVHYLTKAINNSLLQGVSPDDTKIALVPSLDKGISKKNESSNFRPVSILTTFPKIYQKVPKGSLETYMNKFLSLFLFAHRNNYCTQHFWICLVEEWRERLVVTRKKIVWKRRNLFSLRDVPVFPSAKSFRKVTKSSGKFQ